MSTCGWGPSNWIKHENFLMVTFFLVIVMYRKRERAEEQNWWWRNACLTCWTEYIWVFTTHLSESCLQIISSYLLHFLPPFKQCYSFFSWLVYTYKLCTLLTFIALVSYIANTYGTILYNIILYNTYKNTMLQKYKNTQSKRNCDVN